jgi:hypothetical protein
MTTDTSAAEPVLPPAFSDLERFMEWSLPTERERYQKRVASSMDDLQRFYDVAVAHAKEAREYLDEFDITALPPDALRLLWLMFSLISVSYSIDVFGQPRVPDSGAIYVDRVAEPAIPV